MILTTEGLGPLATVERLWQLPRCRRIGCTVLLPTIAVVLAAEVLAVAVLAVAMLGAASFRCFRCFRCLRCLRCLWWRPGQAGGTEARRR